MVLGGLCYDWLLVWLGRWLLLCCRFLRVFCGICGYWCRQFLRCWLNSVGYVSAACNEHLWVDLLFVWCCFVRYVGCHGVLWMVWLGMFGLGGLLACFVFVWGYLSVGVSFVGWLGCDVCGVLILLLLAWQWLFGYVIVVWLCFADL